MTRIREFSASEASALAEQWLSVFALNRKGIDTGSYLWHIFCANGFPAHKGNFAVEAYNQQICCEYVVLSNDRDLAYTVDERPTDRPFSDFYVFPPNFAWTMAFTHEDGWLGPYFAIHPRYTELSVENTSKVKKKKEIEHARQKGWI